MNRSLEFLTAFAAAGLLAAGASAATRWGVASSSGTPSAVPGSVLTSTPTVPPANLDQLQPSTSPVVTPMTQDPAFPQPAASPAPAAPAGGNTTLGGGTTLSKPRPARRMDGQTPNANPSRQ